MDPQAFKAETNLSISRIGALYKDFTAYRELNPEGYEANIQSWLKIFEIMLENDHFDKLSLPSKLTITNDLALKTIGKPLSINLVIQELMKSKDLIPVSVFLDFETEIYQYLNPSTSIFQYLSPFHWAKRVNEVATGVLSIFSSDSERYIVMKHLQSYSKTVLAEIEKENDGLYSSKLYNYKLFKQLLTRLTPKITDLDIKILIKHISRDLKKCSVMYTEDDMICKFDASEVNDEDIGIAQLKWNIQEITKQLESIQERIESTKSKIKAFPVEKIKEKSVKVRIMSLLNTKKVQEASYENISKTHDNLYEILTKMNEATSNIKVFNALKQSSIVLGELNQQIDIDELAEVKEELEDSMQQTNEVSEMLGGVDEDMEEEYESLVKQMEEESLVKEDPQKEHSKEHSKEHLKEHSKGSHKDSQKDSQQPSDDLELINRLNNLKVDNTPIKELSPNKPLPEPST
ncbi:uncharacterized protein CLIB1444_02S09230 [[Candida] jaroonii]|uniref:Uncharacterized protein n=1 Tax=[Candida] jaroonii TaxID=467808 RepID=A0ACA9Y3B9_9ASCO|nr:uncharacterized protein CLIB1444_02S09230 [[Candida] jaroonii]